jgi:hypothetical protein
MFKPHPSDSGTALLNFNAGSFQADSEQHCINFGGANLSLTRHATDPSPSGVTETLQHLAAALDMPLAIDRAQAHKLQALVSFAQEYCSPRAPGTTRVYERPIFVTSTDGAPPVLHQLYISHIVDSNEHLTFVRFDPIAVCPSASKRITEHDIQQLPIDSSSLVVGIDRRSFILRDGDALRVPHKLLEQYEVCISSPEKQSLYPGVRIEPPAKTAASRLMVTRPRILLIHSDGETKHDVTFESISPSAAKILVCDVHANPLNEAPPPFYELMVKSVRHGLEQDAIITNHGPARCFVSFKAKTKLDRSDADALRGKPQQQFLY